VAGSNTVPLWYTDQKVSVSPFIGEYQPIRDIPVAKVATPWDDPKDGSTTILVINEALYFGDRMLHTLLCPNQLRYNGIIVNNTPKIFDPNSSQSIIIPGKIELPLKIHGVLTYVATRKPTEKELQQCDRFELTSSLSWEPNLLDMDRQPSALISKRNPPELNEDLTSHVISSPSVQSMENGSSYHEADVSRRVGIQVVHGYRNCSTHLECNHSRRNEVCPRAIRETSENQPSPHEAPYLKYKDVFR